MPLVTALYTPKPQDTPKYNAPFRKPEALSSKLIDDPEELRELAAEVAQYDGNVTVYIGNTPVSTEDGIRYLEGTWPGPRTGRYS